MGIRLSEQFGVQLKHQGSTKLQIESDGITVSAILVLMIIRYQVVLVRLH